MPAAHGRLFQTLREAAHLLARAGVDSPALCARLLCAAALGLDALGLACEQDRPLRPDEAARLDALLARRAAGEPLAQILGRKEFFGREFRITRDTLIPRPETELLVEAALNLLPAAPRYFADLGTGSGCIGLTLACERRCWRGVLLELHPGALAVARDNAARLLGADAGHDEGCGRLAIVRGSLFALPLGAGTADLVISNPPYIAGSERAQVMDEVLRFEPHGALFSPSGGLAHLAAVCAQAARVLRPGGLLLVEHGAEQGASVRRLMAGAGLRRVETLRDLAGRERCGVGWNA